MARNNHLRFDDTETKVGHIERRSPRALAEDCLHVIRRRGCQMAVTVDPEGWVWVEPPEHAADSDLVGVWPVPATLADQCDAQAVLRECLMGERRAAA